MQNILRLEGVECIRVPSQSSNKVNTSRIYDIVALNVDEISLDAFCHTVACMN